MEAISKAEVIPRVLVLNSTIVTKPSVQTGVLLALCVDNSPARRLVPVLAKNRGQATDTCNVLLETAMSVNPDYS